MQKILVLAGDGIGPEITAEAEKLLRALRRHHDLQFEIARGLIGGSALDATDQPLPPETLALAQESNAVLLGAVGGKRWDTLPRERRPERGLLALRSELGLYANLRPVSLYADLLPSSTLKPEVITDLDLIIVRELTGGLYYGEPRGVRTLDNGERQGYNTMLYQETEIRRIARLAFHVAQRRRHRVCSVDKANVLESMILWREVVNETAREFPDVELSHLYVDNAAMQLVKDPLQFDVLLTENMFGDILSDLAAMMSGSIGMLPSASLDGRGNGLYEPVHGSAPDIANQGLANPLACLLSVALMLRYSLDREDLAARVEQAVGAVLRLGLRTPDLCTTGERPISTQAMGDAVVEQLGTQATADPG